MSLQMPDPPHLLQVYQCSCAADAQPAAFPTLLADISSTVVLADAQPAASFAPSSLAVVLADALAAELLTLFLMRCARRCPICRAVRSDSEVRTPRSRSRSRSYLHE